MITRVNVYARARVLAGAESVGIEDVPVVGEPAGNGEPSSPSSGAGELFQRGHVGGRVHVADAGAAERAAVLSADHAVLGVPSPARRTVQRHVQQYRQSPAQGQTARVRVRRLPAGRFARFVATGPPSERAGQRRCQQVVVFVVVPTTATVWRQYRRWRWRWWRWRTGYQQWRWRRWRRKFRQRRHPDARLT